MQVDTRREQDSAKNVLVAKLSGSNENEESKKKIAQNESVVEFL